MHLLIELSLLSHASFPSGNYSPGLQIFHTIRETLKTHIADHFMPLGILLASFILAAIRVSCENMSMKEYLDLQDSALLTLWSEKRIIFWKM